MNRKEQLRVMVLNEVERQAWTVDQAAMLLGLSVRHVRRLLAAYRKEGAAAIAHGNRGRRPAHATPEAVRRAVLELTQERYTGANHHHLTELLAEGEGITLARSTVRRILTAAGIATPGSADPQSTADAVSASRKRGCCSKWTAVVTIGSKAAARGLR